MVRLVNEDIANKKILVVGAGGIGCELLKNLVLTGFAQIHVVCFLCLKHSLVKLTTGARSIWILLNWVI